jgi:HEAT repeat protein
MRKGTTASLFALALGLFAAGPAFAQDDPFAAAAAQAKSSNPRARYDAAGALGSIRGPRSVAVLSGLLSSDADARVRQAAASSLGQLGDLSAVPALIAELKDASAPARFAAVRSLGALRAPAAVPALSGLLSDPDPSMRRTAAQMLGQIADPAAKDALNKSLADADEGTRLEVADALARMGDAGGLAAAQDGLRSKDPVSRRRAALALSRSDDPAALSALDAAYAGEKEGATRAALGTARSRIRERLGRKKAAASSNGK